MTRQPKRTGNYSGVLATPMKIHRTGARILEGQFTAVQQAIGTKPDRVAGAAFLRDFVEEVKASGFVASLIEKHGVTGRLTVAPPAVGPPAPIAPTRCSRAPKSSKRRMSKCSI